MCHNFAPKSLSNLASVVGRSVVTDNDPMALILCVHNYLGDVPLCIERRYPNNEHWNGTVDCRRASWLSGLKGHMMFFREICQALNIFVPIPTSVLRQASTHL